MQIINGFSIRPLLLTLIVPLVAQTWQWMGYVHNGLDAMNNLSDDSFSWPSPLFSVTGSSSSSTTKSSSASMSFVQQVEQLDGMTESLRRLLLEAANNNKHTHNNEWDPTEEKKRCERYGFTLPRSHRRDSNRRRIFWGSLIADDSWHVLGLASMEYFGLFDTIAFVESNTTQSLIPRSLRFPPNSTRKDLLQSPLLWGNETRVHVDYYQTSSEDYIAEMYRKKELMRENDQRNVIFHRWKENGMTADDIGFLSDVDEMATHDFILALQVCHVPEFYPMLNPMRVNATLPKDRPHDCVAPKIATNTIVYEGSPMCLQVKRRWYHPDFIIGACIQTIGDDSLRETSARQIRSGAMQRIPTWQKRHVRQVPWRNDKKKKNNNNNNTVTTVPMAPLWDATDIRMMGAGRRAMGTTSQGIPYALPTGYHFHNFFDSLSTLRRKYLTYGHPKKGAMELPLGEIQPNDVGFLVTCLSERPIETASLSSRSKWSQPKKSDWANLDPIHGTPIAFQRVPEYVQLRHGEFQLELKADELLHPPVLNVSISP
jgi:hypothetical protein